MKANRVASEATASTAAMTPRSGKLVKRAEAARMLGMSVSTLRRREGDVLTPIVGPDGVHLFDETEVRAVMVTVRGSAALAAMGPSAGDIAADVFTLLDDDVHPVEIVRRLRLTPDLVIALHGQWAAMRGGFTLGPDQALELGGLSREGTPTSAADAIRALRNRIDGLTLMRQGSAECRWCRDKTASVCEVCVVLSRGPLAGTSCSVERRTDGCGVEEVRVVGGFCWESIGDVDGTIAQLRSDWHRVDSLAQSEIGGLVRRIERRDAEREAARR